MIDIEAVPKLKRYLRQCFATDQLHIVDEWYEPRRMAHVFIHEHDGERYRVFVPEIDMRRFAPPPPDPVTEAITVMAEALHEARKRRERERELRMMLPLDIDANDG